MQPLRRWMVVLALASLMVPRAAAALPSCGDASGTGGIAASDALLALKKAVGHNVTCPECACDTTADHSITSADALAILRRAVGSIRYLSCFNNLACQNPSARLFGIDSANSAPAALVAGTTFGLDTDAPAFLKLFGGGLSVEIPAVVLDSNRIAAAAPPLAAQVVAPPMGFRAQALQGSPLVATDVIEALSIEALPAIPNPVGKVTSEFLQGTITHAEQLLGQLPPGGAMANAVSQLHDVLATLLAGVVALRDLQTDAVPLGTRGGEAVVLTRDDLAQVDAMILATLLAQSELPDSSPPAGQSSSLRFPRTAGNDCRQSESKAYWDALLHDVGSVAQSDSYTNATCASAAAKTSYAVILGPPALAVGILALTGVTAAGVSLALPAAAILYVSLAGAGGLIAVGGALKDTSHDAVELVKQGVALAEATMQQMVTGQVLPETAGTLYDMASATKDLSEAFQGFQPSPTTTLVSTTTTTVAPPTTTLPITTTTMDSPTTTIVGPGCYCCCAYWTGCPPCNLTCKQLPSPDSPPEGGAFCTYYAQNLCDQNICEGP